MKSNFDGHLYHSEQRMSAGDGINLVNVAAGLSAARPLGTEPVDLDFKIEATAGGFRPTHGEARAALQAPPVVSPEKLAGGVKAAAAAESLSLQPPVLYANTMPAMDLAPSERKKGPQRGSAKRKGWTLAEKRQVCIKYRDGDYKSQALFVRELNKEKRGVISASTFQSWWNDVKNGNLVLNEITLDSEEGKKKRRRGKYARIESRLLSYVDFCHKNRLTESGDLTGTALQEKAMQFANEAGLTEFKASNGWLWKFRERNGLQRKARVANNKENERLTTSQVSLAYALSSPYAISHSKNALVVLPYLLQDVQAALSVLASYAVQENNDEFAMDVARLHHKLARHQRDRDQQTAPKYDFI